MGAGSGAYTPAEAALLVGLRTERVRRWTQGYSVKSSGAKRTASPLFRRQLPVVDGKIALSFLDLLEVLFVHAFLEEGVTMPTIRKAADEAATVFKTTHPFSLRRFQTDGQAIFAKFADERGVERLLHLGRGGQIVLAKVIEPLLRQLDRDADTEQANRWWPLGKERRVVLDPTRVGGVPIIAGFGLPTRVLYRVHLAGDRIDKIADWYDVPVDHVRDAIAFEESRRQLRQAA